VARHSCRCRKKNVRAPSIPMSSPRAIRIPPPGTPIRRGRSTRLRRVGRWRKAHSGCGASSTRYGGRCGSSSFLRLSSPSFRDKSRLSCGAKADRGVCSREWRVAGEAVSALRADWRNPGTSTIRPSRPQQYPTAVPCVCQARRDGRLPCWMKNEVVRRRIVVDAACRDLCNQPTSHRAKETDVAAAEMTQGGLCHP
jgi:hypothetical protein